jgi:cytochrome c biogenesis protein CcdA/thiol-disulfide isomerase/thioredoxin
MLFLLISFTAGILTVLAPCILPLLPVIIGGSATGGSNKRAYTIIGSLIVSIVVFTLLVKVSSVFLSVSPEFWKIFSGGILILLSVSYIFPSVWQKVPYLGRLSVSSNKALGKGFQKNTFWGDVLAGAALGPVFSTCSPTYFVILATVLPASFLLGVVYLSAYAVGLGVVLLLISLLGQRFADKLGALSNPDGKFKKTIGALFLIVGLSIIFGLDKKLSTKLLDAGFFDVTKIEQKLLEKVTIGDNKSTESKEETTSEIELKSQGKYKEFVGISEYLNTDGREIKLADYIGKKIILLDIMTYSCINCQRTIPYLNEWHRKYEDKGLVIIGIHAPEFAFEKNSKNVQKELVEKQRVKFPVVLDNDFKTWRAYNNQYWPHKYIIDLNGDIVYDHIGEGAYEETELVIKKLLETMPENSSGIQAGTTSFDFGDLSKVSSRETYLGYERMDFITNPIDRACADAVCDYTLQRSQKNTFSFGGKWKVENERSLAQKGSKLRYTFDAAKFHLVAGAPEGAKFKVTLDGTMVKMVDVREQTLYTLADFGQDYSEHTIEIEVVSGNPELYAITFG